MEQISRGFHDERGLILKQVKEIQLRHKKTGSFRIKLMLIELDLFQSSLKNHGRVCVRFRDNLAS